MAASTSTTNGTPDLTHPDGKDDGETTTSGIDTNCASSSQLAGLVEAATAAAGTDWAAASAAVEAAATAAAAEGNNHQLDGYTGNMPMEESDYAGFGQQMGKSSRKRKRMTGEEPLDPVLAQQQQQQQQRNESPEDMQVHASAALFRPPSSNKKHTRPPMSKLFSSLEQMPENFLQLQSAAKAYMLDDNHPERRDCVGQRGRGDTEIVKLRLWNCVRDFLLEDDRGDRFFGEAVPTETMTPRSNVWPRDQQKIISLMIPLLRRMVTNERQRKYAVETRKSGPAEERKRKTTTTADKSSSPPTAQYPPGEQLQVQHNGFSPPLPPLPEMSVPMEGTQQLGLTDLFEDGYRTDWDALSRTYDTYNKNYELDNLWSISGIQQPDWRGLVATVDSHYQISHDGNCLCGPECETRSIRRLVSSEEVLNLDWRVGGQYYDAARSEFVSSISRDISRIVREHLASSNSIAPPTPPAPPHQGEGGSKSATLQINILQNGKRSVPPITIPSYQCSDLNTLKQFISVRFSSDKIAKVQVLLPDGLAPVTSDGEWTVATISAGSIDWMEEVKVIVDV